MLYQTYIETPLGTMIACADDHTLHLLQFTDTVRTDLLKSASNTPIINNDTSLFAQLAHELNLYFTGSLQSFTIPLTFHGTPFQHQVWRTLQTIPYGTTRAYTEIAQSVGKPTAARAVGNANGANQFVIIIPCHRVIAANGTLGGYSAGIERKKKLLQIELMQK